MEVHVKSAPRLEGVVTFIAIGLIVFVAALDILTSRVIVVVEKAEDISNPQEHLAAKRRAIAIPVYTDFFGRLR